MGQLLVGGLDDATLTRLDIVARGRSMSAEELARQAINDVVRLTRDEKLSIVAQMQAITNGARVPGVAQTSGVDLIREDRER